MIESKPIPMPKTEEDQTTIGAGSNVKLGFVIGLAAGLAWVGWVTSELNTIKSSLTKINGIELLSARVDSIDANGSKALRDLQKEMLTMSKNIEVYMTENERRMRQNQRTVTP